MKHMNHLTGETAFWFERAGTARWGSMSTR